MKKYLKKFTISTAPILMLFFCIYGISVVAQDQKSLPTSIAKKNLVNLSSGLSTLVVKIPTASNTIATLKGKLNNNQLSANQRDLINQKITQLQNNLDDFKFNLIHGFMEFYDFSKVRFIYSDDSKKLIERQASGYFIDPTTGEIKDNITLESDDFVQLETRYNSSGDYIELLSFVAKDSNNKFLNNPFPLAGSSSIIFIINSMFTSKKDNLRQKAEIEYLIKRQNKLMKKKK